MFIQTFENQERYAVVSIHGEIVGIYSKEFAAVDHARKLSKYGNRPNVTCRWMSFDAVKASLNDNIELINAQLAKSDLKRSEYLIMLDDIRRFQAKGEGNWAVLEKDGTVARRP